MFKLITCPKVQTQKIKGSVYGPNQTLNFDVFFFVLFFPHYIWPVCGWFGSHFPFPLPIILKEVNFPLCHLCGV